MRHGKYFWKGIRCGIPLCCILFFEDGLEPVRREYVSTMHRLTNNQGIVLCPECLVGRLGRKVPEMRIKIR